MKAYILGSVNVDWRAIFVKLFFDTEFTGLSKDTMLISIGIISEDGRKFYAEFVDYDKSKCDEWVMCNVIHNLRFPIPETGEDYYYVAYRTDNNPPGNNFYSSWSLEMNGDVERVRNELLKWLDQYDNVEFVSDVCHYDFVLLIDLLTGGGTALELPEYISSVCHDINQDIAHYFEVSDYEAFDINREEIVEKLNGYFVIGEKHNSLYDAEVIRAIYKQIEG